MRTESLTPAFRQTLSNAGYPVFDIQADIARRPCSPARTLRSWTGLPDGELRRGLFNHDRDVIAPKINQAILSTLSPWIQTGVDECLPGISVKQIARRTGIPAERITTVLSKYPFCFSINGSQFTAEAQKPVFPKRRLKLTDSRIYMLSPQDVIASAKYRSRKKGGSAVQKARIKSKKVDSVMRQKAWEEVRVVIYPTTY